MRMLGLACPDGRHDLGGMGRESRDLRGRLLGHKALMLGDFRAPQAAGPWKCWLFWLKWPFSEIKVEKKKKERKVVPQGVKVSWDRSFWLPMGAPFCEALCGLRISAGAKSCLSFFRAAVLTANTPGRSSVTVTSAITYLGRIDLWKQISRVGKILGI